MSIKKIKPASSAYGYPLLLKTLLQQSSACSPLQEIVFQDKVRYNYSILEKRVARLACLLKECGVEPGDTVGVMDYDSHRYLESMFAVPMMGAILHTVNFNRSPENLAYTINHADETVILIHPELFPLFESFKAKLNTPKKIIFLSDDGNIPETDLNVIGDYESLLARQNDIYPFPDFDENAAATLLYTTGASATPKGVCFSHRQLVMHTFGIMSALCAYPLSPMITSADVYMPLSPMFHVHAWGMPYLFTLLGAKQVYPGKSNTIDILKLIHNENVSFSHCQPGTLHSIINAPSLEDTDLSKWKIIVGGAPLPQSLCDKALNLNIDLCSVYGMAETGPILALSGLKSFMKDQPLDKQIEIRCRAGHAIPMVSLKVLDIMGRALPHDGKSIGEIVARAPWLAQTYFKDSKKSEKLWADEWLHTGDVGFIDPDGYLQITDRVKDAIKTDGEWVNSVELEDIICEHDAVSEAAVTGFPDEKSGEKPLAFVVLKPGYEGRVSEKDIQEFCMKYVENGMLPSYGVPEQIAIVDTIPTTTVGKINKKQLMLQHEKPPFDLSEGP